MMISFRDLPVEQKRHDYVQSYQDTYCMARIGENAEPVLIYNTGCDGGHAIIQTVGPQALNRHRDVELDDLWFEQTPPPMGVFNYLNNPERISGYTFCVSRQLNRNWKRGLHWNRLRFTSVDDFDVHESTIRAIRSIFYPVVPTLDQLLNREYAPGRREMWRWSAMIGNELIVQATEGRLEYCYLYWYNTPIGAANLVENRAKLLAEYEYLIPKVEDFFGEVNVS